MLVAVKLVDHSGSLYGKVSIGGWDKTYLSNQSQTDPIWTAMEYLAPFGGTRGGWVFGLSGLIIGDSQPIFFFSNKTVVKTVLMHERDIGYNYVTNKRETGTEFTKTIMENFAQLTPVCRSVNQTADIEVFSCTFGLKKCSLVAAEMKQVLQLRLPERNVRIDMNISDILIENPLECKLNMQVHVDGRIKDDEKRVEIGLATFARSQYVIFDYDRKYIGFGGPHDMKPNPNPYQPKGMSGLAIFFLIVALLLILAIGVFGVKKYREKKLEEGLLRLDAEGSGTQ